MSDDEGESGDDDWFERALDDENGDGTDGDEASDAPEEGESADDGSTDSSDDDSDRAGGESADAETESSEVDADTDDAEAESSEAESGEAEPEANGGRDGAGESPFDEDFAAAFENAPDPDGDGGFGGGDDDFDGESIGGDDDDFGGGGFGGEGAGVESFAAQEADFESELDRVRLGIEGLDEMILGGIPERSLMVVLGSAGTGKTTFALQFLNEALERDERAVYLTLEESSERILATAEEKGWPFADYVADGQLAIVHLDPIEMANSLSNIRNDLPRLIGEFGAERFVLDSVSLLEMMYDHRSKRRSEVYQFTRALKDAGITTLVTSEASVDDAYTSRHGIIEYLSDAVFVLQYVRPSDFRETRLAVEIQKIRDANHSRETKPYEITNEGLSVYRQANIF